jgi:hypothetical protein
MADYTIKSGDTWPPMTVTLTESADLDDPEGYSDDDGNFVKRVDFFSSPPDSIRMIAKLASPSNTFDGPMENVEVVDGSDDVGLVAGEEPGLGVPKNRGQARYPWAANDTDTPGEGYELEFEVTWDGSSTPPKIETFPNESQKNPTLDIDPDLD